MCIFLLYNEVKETSALTFQPHFLSRCQRRQMCGDPKRSKDLLPEYSQSRSCIFHKMPGEPGPRQHWTLHRDAACPVRIRGKR